MDIVEPPVYLDDPVGRAVVGRTFVHLCSDARTFATFLWGRPDLDDVAALTDVICVEMRDSVPPHVSLADVRYLTHVDEAAFTQLTAYFESVRLPSTKQIQKQAMVFGTGLAGTVAAGYFVAFQAPFPYQGFTSLDEAAEWLGISKADAQGWDALREEAAASPPELSTLRTWMTGNLPSATLEAAASALGLSFRTLQRKLANAGTSFQKVRDDVRFAVATSRLHGEGSKLSALALALGFASHQHFTDWFRSRTGESPSAYRRRDR